MRRRFTARVLLLDPADRILLLKGRLPASPADGGVGFTVGGGVEPGESLMQAAAREIREETGFTDAVLGPVVWRREGPLELRPGETVLMDESYILARCGGGEPSRSGWTALEYGLLDDICWWSIDDLSGCGDKVHPPGLARLLSALLDSGAPDEPITLP